MDQFQPKPLLVDKKVAARVLGGLSRRSLENLVEAGELSIRRIGRRTLFEWRELEEFVKHDHKTQKKAA